MILRWTLTIAGWCAIACAPMMAAFGIWSTFRIAQTSEQDIQPAMLVSALAGIIPAVVVSLGFGAAMLMLTSIDKRLANLEGNT